MLVVKNSLVRKNLKPSNCAADPEVCTDRPFFPGNCMSSFQWLLLTVLQSVHLCLKASQRAFSIYSCQDNAGAKC